MQVRTAFVLFCVLISIKAEAVSSYLSMGYGRGGTHLPDVTGGQNYNTQAGSGLFITGGALFVLSPTIPHRFEMEFGLGYMFQDDARQEENRVSWSRIPIEALYFYRNTREMFRLGWGATYHVGNRISAKGTNASADISVENALGWLISGEKLFSSNEDGLGAWGLGFRYLWINYKSSSFAKDADGSGWSLTLSFVGP